MIAIDIGGTFTDLIRQDADGSIHIAKRPSSVDPADAFIASLAAAQAQSDLATLKQLVHASTVATNAIIEGKAAHAALLVTQGFRDIFEIARQTRHELYNVFFDKVPPLIARGDCFEIEERLDASGTVLQPLLTASLAAAVAAIKQGTYDAVVCCFLHSYQNATHERQALAYLKDELPHLAISISSDICPEIREFYRASTAAINAKLMPVMSHYLGRVEPAVAAIAPTANLSLMTSSGGRISAREGRLRPVKLIESGPAAGVIAAARLSSQAGFKQVISFDMGGTTAKLGLINDGGVKIAHSFEVGAQAEAGDRPTGYPVQTPVVDLVEIGAGGGSMAWIDPGEALRVGPRSAGATPGPAAYNQGNDAPTVTDANLVLGRLDAGQAIGAIALHQDLADAAVDRLAKALNLTRESCAAGIIDIAINHMALAVRRVSIQRGYDPRHYCLTSFGGAGPLHACALADALRIPQILIPRHAGVASAWGLLLSDRQYEQSVSILKTDQEATTDQLTAIIASTKASLIAEAQIDGDAENLDFAVQLDCRYDGQAFDLSVPWEDSLSKLIAAFHTAHERNYGYRMQDAVQISSLRVSASLPNDAQIKPYSSRSSIKRETSQRTVFIDGAWQQLNVYQRDTLGMDTKITGPAIITEDSTTTILATAWHLSVDSWGNLLLQKTDSK